MNESILQSIRKLSPNYCDLSTMVANMNFLFRNLALNVDTRNEKRIPNSTKVITAVSTIAYAYTYVYSTLWNTFCRCAANGDWISASTLFSLTVTSVIGFIRLTAMWMFQDLVHKIVSKYLDCDARVETDSRFAKNLRDGLRTIKTRAIIYWMVVMSNGIIYSSKPIVTPGRHFQVEAFIIYGLEPAYESPNFEISVAIIAWNVMFSCYIVGNITCLVILLIGYIECHMTSIGKELLHIWNDALQHYDKETKPVIGLINSRKFKLQPETIFDHSTVSYDDRDRILNAYIKEHLIDILQKHVVNLQMIREIEDAMRHPTAIAFLFLVTGLIAELLGGLADTYLQLPYTLTQFATDCYIGQKLMDAGVSFERAVYECRWENFDVANRKLVLIMLMNSQKQLNLSAGGVAILNFSLFMSIIRMCYSTYTTLRSSI